MTAKVVYKYEIRGDERPIQMPADATIVHVAEQDSRLMLWAEHILPDENTSVAVRKFSVFGTGHQIPFGAEYVGTFFNGPFVFHVYEILENA